MTGQQKPPKIILRLLKWFCKSQYHADIEGDLIEQYNQNLQTMSAQTAKWRCFRDLFQLFRPGIVRPITERKVSFRSLALLKSSLKVSVRGLFKRKGFSLVNILGLSMGTASCLLMALYVQDELSYDEFFDNSDRIFKLVETRKTTEQKSVRSLVPYSFARTLPVDFPEVVTATAFSGPYSGQQVQFKNKAGERVDFLEDHVLLADNNFFSVFSLRLLKGDRHTALQKPNSIVLTETTAQRFFGDEDPVGKLLTVAGKPSVVTAICEDVPDNSHIKFNYLVSSVSVAWFSQEDFSLRPTHCYAKLHPEAKAALLETKFPAMAATHMSAEIERINGVSWASYEAAGNGFIYNLKPLTAIHLDPNNLGGLKKGGNINTIKILVAISLLIFIIACANFINMTTAKSGERAREVGVRKALGSQRIQLISQFMCESLLLSFVSMVVAVALVALTLPAFNELTSKSLSFDPDLSVLLWLFFLALIVGGIAGIYPSLVLSAFKPVNVLKGNFQTRQGGNWLRNGLVVFQFWICIVLIISTFTIQQQNEFLLEKDLGFDKEQLIVIESTFDRRGNFAKPFLDEISQWPQIKNAAGTLWVPGFQGTRSNTYRHEGSSDLFNTRDVIVGDLYAETMGLDLLEGTFFSKPTQDANQVLLNQAAVLSMGLIDPVGKKISMISKDNDQSVAQEYIVKGVVKDFHYRTLHQEIDPMVIHSNEQNSERMSSIVARVTAGSTAESIQLLSDKWEAMIPDRPFRFRFLDEVLDQRYRSEQQTARVLSTFSGLSIFIAIIGLFSLAAYSVSCRAKEIGVRKVVGASTVSILTMLTRGFSAMVLVAFVLAIPVSWYGMHSWLSNFAFRIRLSPLVFMLAGVLVLFVACTVVCMQSFRAARMNPIHYLRQE